MPGSTRAGGALLAFGALAYAVAVVVYVVLYGQPAPADPEAGVTVAARVAHYQGRHTLAHALWAVELVAALSIAVAGFVLHGRGMRVGSAWLSGVAWTTVGVGALLLSLMYAVMLGGYPSAAAAFATEPGLFAALNGIATFLFDFGSAVLFLGLAGAFAAESGSPEVLPAGVAKAGAMLSLLSALVAVGMLADVAALSAAAPLGLAMYLLAAYHGFALWRKTGRSAAQAAG